MRLFQNIDVYPQYMAQLQKRLPRSSYAEIWAALLHDRFYAVHLLQPVLEGDSDTMFAVGRDEASQRDWARAQGMPRRASRRDILLAQIEHHRTEIFYNMDAMRFDSTFVRALPGCVRRTIAWRAGPSRNVDFGAHDLIVCNFESILRSYRAQGWRAAWFAPAFDPVMADYATAPDRKWDIVFVGSYSRHHRNRAAIVDALAGMAKRHRVRICLQRSLLTQVADTLPDWMPLLGTHAVPASIAGVAATPVYGRDLYALFSGAKIVVNGAIDMAGPDRGNMRCWETLGCGALMLSDQGAYPDGFEAGRTMQTYGSVPDLVARIHGLLNEDEARTRIAEAGHAMIRSRYAKDRQWRDFQQLVR